MNENFKIRRFELIKPQLIGLRMRNSKCTDVTHDGEFSMNNLQICVKLESGDIIKTTFFDRGGITKIYDPLKDETKFLFYCDNYHSDNVR